MNNSYSGSSFVGLFEAEFARSLRNAFKVGITEYNGTTYFWVGKYWAPSGQNELFPAKGGKVLIPLWAFDAFKDKVNKALSKFIKDNYAAGSGQPTNRACANMPDEGSHKPWGGRRDIATDPRASVGWCRNTANFGRNAGAYNGPSNACNEGDSACDTGAEKAYKSGLPWLNDKEEQVGKKGSKRGRPKKDRASGCKRSRVDNEGQHTEGEGGEPKRLVIDEGESEDAAE